MNPVEAKYEVVARGRIRLCWEKNLRMEETFRRHEKVIDEIFREATRESSGALFNGTVFCFGGLEKRQGETRIQGSFVEYKHFIAHRKRPDLNLGIQAIGVSGMTRVKDHASLKEYVLLAKRASHLTFYPGFYECVPTGHISREFADDQGNVDYIAQLLSEFSEETGLSATSVKEISEFAFVYDPTEDVYDVCCSIEIAKKKDSIFSEFRSTEYESPMLLEIELLPEFFVTHHDQVVPTSLGLFDALRQIRNQP